MSGGTEAVDVISPVVTGVLTRSRGQLVKEVLLLMVSMSAEQQRGLRSSQLSKRSCCFHEVSRG